MFLWLIGTCNHGLKALVRFSAKILSKNLVLFTKMRKMYLICLEIDPLIFWIGLHQVFGYCTLWTHSLITFEQKNGQGMIAYSVIFYGYWVHSIFTKHSIFVSSLRGFETKLKFLHKNVFQDINDYFHAKKFKEISIYRKLKA